MFMLCVVSKGKKSTMQDNQDKDTSTDKVQSTREYKKTNKQKKMQVGSRFCASVQTMSSGSLSRG